MGRLLIIVVALAVVAVVAVCVPAVLRALSARADRRERARVRADAKDIAALLVADRALADEVSAAIAEERAPVARGRRV